MEQRRANIQAAKAQLISQGLMQKDQSDKPDLPRELERSYQVYIVHGENSKKKVVKMRDARANMIGSLLNIRGIVVRASDVKP